MYLIELKKSSNIYKVTFEFLNQFSVLEICSFHLETLSSSNIFASSKFFVIKSKWIFTMSQSSSENCRCDCLCPKMEKNIVTHQVCTPRRYHGPGNLPPPMHYLYWSTRPIISYTSTDEQAQTWMLKRRTPGCEDIYYQELFDKNGNRIYWSLKIKVKEFSTHAISKFSIYA